MIALAEGHKAREMAESTPGLGELQALRELQARRIMQARRNR